MKQATLVLLCGLPGAGKTTLAKQLADEMPAVVMSPDQELYERGISFFDEKARTDIEAEQWKRALELAKSGKNVVLENGFWGREEREKLRIEAHALGLEIGLRYLDVPLEKLWQRVDARNKREPDKDAVITFERLEQNAKHMEPPTKEELALFD
jgi:predicted kinase